MCENNDGQQNSSLLYTKEGRDSKQGDFRHCIGLLALGHIQKDHTYYRTHPRFGELRSRQGVQENEGPIRLSAESVTFPGNQQKMGKNSAGLICKPMERPSNKLLLLDEATRLKRSRCSDHEMGKIRKLRLPPLDSNSESNSEGSIRASSNNSHNPILAKEKLVQSSPLDVNRPTHNAAKSSNNFENRRRSSSSTGQGLSSHRMETIRKSITDKGISRKAAEIISYKNRKSTEKLYDGHWAQWASWCSGRKIHPISAPIDKVMDYLIQKFEEGLEVSSLGVIRSAISSAMEPYEGQKVGNHPLIIDFFKGLANNRPKKPKQTPCWSAQQVLDTFLSWGENSSISIKLLTWKVATLMALASAGRSQELAHLDWNFKQETPEGILFKLSTHKKNRKATEDPGHLYISKIDQKGICPVQTLLSYIERTKIYRNPSGPNLLFRSLLKHDQGVAPNTISRWITNSIAESGQTFQQKAIGHTVRDLKQSP